MPKIEQVDGAKDADNNKARCSGKPGFVPHLTDQARNFNSQEIQQAVKAVNGSGVLSRENVYAILQSGAKSVQAFKEMEASEQEAGNKSIYPNSQEFTSDKANLDLDQLEGNLVKWSKFLQEFKENHPNPTHKQVESYNGRVKIYNFLRGKYTDQLPEQLPRKFDLVPTDLKAGASYDADFEIKPVDNGLSEYPDSVLEPERLQDSFRISSKPEARDNNSEPPKEKPNYRAIKDKIEHYLPSMLRSRTPIESQRLILEYKELRNQKYKLGKKLNEDKYIKELERLYDKMIGQDTVSDDPEKYIKELERLYEKMIDQDTVSSEPEKYIKELERLYENSFNQNTRNPRDEVGTAPSGNLSDASVLSKLKKLPPEGFGDPGEETDKLITAYREIQKKRNKALLKISGIGLTIIPPLYGAPLIFKSTRKKLANLAHSYIIYDNWIKELNRRLDAFQPAVEGVEQPFSLGEIRAKVTEIQNVLRVREGKQYDNEMANHLEGIAKRAGITKLFLWATIRIANVGTDERLSQQDATLSVLMKKASQLIKQWKKEEPVWKAIIQTNKYLDKFEECKKNDENLLKQGLALANREEDQFNRELETARTRLQDALSYLAANRNDTTSQTRLIDDLNSTNRGFKTIDEKMPGEFKGKFQENEARRNESEAAMFQESAGTQVNVVSNRESNREKGKSVWHEFVPIWEEVAIEQRKANIVCLGENHLDKGSRDLFAKLIDEDDSSEDPLLLREGIQSMKEVEQKDCAVAGLVSRRVKVLGWDDAILHTVGLISVVYQDKLKDLLASRGNDISFEAQSSLFEQISYIQEKIKDMSKERNRSLIDTLRNLGEESYNRKIFVIGGYLHFTEDSSVKKELNKQLSIVLKPLRDETEGMDPQEFSEKVRQYYDENAIAADLRTWALSNC